MEMNGYKALALATCLSMTAGTATAEEGFYYGGALGFAKLESQSTGIGRTEGQDAFLGVVLGYRFSHDDQSWFGVEGTLDGTTGQRMTTVGVPVESCSDESPDWCEVRGIARVRGVYGAKVTSDIEVLSMVGVAAVAGLAEDGPGNYVDTTATGLTIGVGGQRPMGGGMGRLEFVYDRFEGSNPGDFEKTLEIFSLRTVFTF